MVEYLVSLFTKVWDEENIPEDWSKGIIITLGKKGDTSHCCNNRGITAMPLRWFGHVVRMPEHRLPMYLVDWKLNNGKRSRGRPRKSWIACVKEDAANFTGIADIDIGRVEQLAYDRVHWREMIRHKRDFIGAGHSND